MDMLHKSLDLPEGHRWAVIGDNDGSLLIPTWSIEKLTDEELIKYLRLHTKEGRIIWGEYEVEDLEKRKYYLNPENPGWIDIKALKEFLLEYGDLRPYSEIINKFTEKAENLIALKEAHIANRASRKKSKPRTKNPDQAKDPDKFVNHDEFFIVVGKRDGFQCSICNSTKDLDLVHMVAPPEGKHKVENLKLICMQCREVKG